MSCSFFSLQRSASYNFPLRASQHSSFLSSAVQIFPAGCCCCPRRTIGFWSLTTIARSEAVYLRTLRVYHSTLCIVQSVVSLNIVCSNFPAGCCCCPRRTITARDLIAISIISIARLRRGSARGPPRAASIRSPALGVAGRIR